MFVIWLVIAAVMIIIEIATLGLTTIWFAGGAIVAAFTVLAGLHFMLQLVVFAVVSLLLLVFTRPVAAKFFSKGLQKTNAESMVGKTAIAVERIDNNKLTGCVKAGGLEWSARTANGEIIDDGEEVVIKEIQGVKLIVEKKDNMEV